MDLTFTPQRITPQKPMPRITLDNPVIGGVRGYARRPVVYETVERPATSVPVSPPEPTAPPVSYHPEPTVVEEAQPTGDYSQPAVETEPEIFVQDNYSHQFAAPAEYAMSQPKLRGKHLLYALAAVFVCIGIVGSVMFFRQYHTLQKTVSAAPDSSSSVTSQPNSDTNVATSNFSVDSADETMPGAGVFASALYTINIDKIKAHAPVFSMKLMENGVLQVPKNIYHVGWYDQSAEPGKSGAGFMFGHVNGPTKNGIFAHLDRMEAGDIVRISSGVREISYKVVSVETKSVTDIDMSSMLNSVEPGVRGLNIMSCDDTSHFNAKDHTYDGRVIVRTVEV